MAKENRPSIYDDRGTIGSFDELDEYGVWVKSEPQDFAFEEAETPDLSGDDDIDLAIPDIEDLPDFNIFQEETEEAPKAAIQQETPEEDDFSIPDTELGGEEDNDSDVFNFGELSGSTDLGSDDFQQTTEEFEFPSLIEEDETQELVPEDIETNTPEGDDAEGFTEMYLDDFIGALDEEPENSLDSFPDMPEDSPIEFESEASYEEPSPSGVIEPELRQDRPPDLSTQLLMKIAEELSSIRSELSSLKKEFSGLRTKAPQSEVEDKDFYSEEDDEKISLTGDELNNILNTADFTEEAGADATIELAENTDLTVAEETTDNIALESLNEDDSASEMFSSIEVDMGIESLESLEGEINLEDNAVLDVLQDENSLEPEALEDGFPDFTALETEELDEILEKGVEPMASAPAPEDSDYLAIDSVTDPLIDNLEDTNLVIEESSTDLSESLDLSDSVDLEESIDLSESVDLEESIDLSEAVIDEPDLSSEIQDNPIEEPSLEEISINLDLSDLDSEEENTVESGSDSSLIPEGFVEEEAEPLIEMISDEFQTLPEESQEEEISEEIAESVDLAESSDLAESTDLMEIFEPEESGLEMLDEPGELALDSAAPAAEESPEIPSHLKQELKTVLAYMDQLLENLPDDKIEEFAKSEYYETYKKLFKELGLA